MIQSLADFEVDLKGNLYKFWNRMSSGSYFPSPVLAVEDRIAQMVVKIEFEPLVEPHFLPDSYGYRGQTGQH